MLSHLKRPSTELQGEMLVALEAFVWSLFPIFTLLSLDTLSPLASAGLSCWWAALFFAGVLTVRGRWHELAVRAAWPFIIAASMLLIVCYYGLVFFAASLTTAGNISILMLMEVFFSFVVLRLWKKEPPDNMGAIGGGLMMVGAAMVLMRGGLRPNAGDLIVVAACIFPAFGNYFTQQARKLVSAEVILFIRSAIGGIVFLTAAELLGQVPTFMQLSESLWFVIINGMLLLGFSKILWVEAIHRIAISKATALSSAAPVFTLLFAYMILGEIPSWWQLCGLLPIIAGIVLLTRRRKVSGECA